MAKVRKRGTGWQIDYFDPNGKRIRKSFKKKDVQEIHGHKTMTMTLRYAHLSQEHKKKAVNLLNRLTASKLTDDTCHKSVTAPPS